MEEKFVNAWLDARKKAEAQGIHFRPMDKADAMKRAHQCLSGHRESDGFFALQEKGLLALSLEALAVKKQFTSLFSDEEANNALTRLLSAGYRF